jgi:sugar phosphate isomerase/epimerase
MDRLALEFISVLGMPPVEYVELAARLGLKQIGFSPKPITANPHGYAPFDLGNDPVLLRATKAALIANGITASLGEGFLIVPGVDVADAAHNMDAMAELGTPVVNTIVMEQDRSRALDQFAIYAAMAAKRGMIACLEYMPMMWPANIDEAVGLVHDSGAANGRVLLDAMHFFRSGSTLPDLARIDPSIIGYAQVCDVPMPASNPEYGMEARDNRLPLGEGNLPLAEFVAAVPKDVTIGLELPLADRAAAGSGPEERLVPSIAIARRLITNRRVKSLHSRHFITAPNCSRNREKIRSSLHQRYAVLRRDPTNRHAW